MASGRGVMRDKHSTLLSNPVRFLAAVYLFRDKFHDFGVT